MTNLSLLGDRIAVQLESELEETKERLAETTRELNKMKIALEDFKTKFDDMDLERRKLLDRLSDSEDNISSMLFDIFVLSCLYRLVSKAYRTRKNCWKLN